MKIAETFKQGLAISQKQSKCEHKIKSKRTIYNYAARYRIRGRKHRFVMVATVIVMVIVIALVVTSCQVGYGFRGPGYTPERSVTLVEADDLVWLVITTGEISAGKGKAFSAELKQVMKAIPTHEGLIGYSVQKQLIGSTVWTMSIWTDLEALQRFTGSPAHRQAVRQGGIPADTFRSVMVEIPASRVPVPWKEAKRLIADAGNENSD